MSYTRIWLHCVWGTKNRFPFIDDSNKKQIFKHIKENASIKGIYIDFINGHQDHVHCLLALKSDMTITKTMQLLKGESSFWINKNNLCQSKFEWADEYFAVSISESQVSKVRAYIKNQEQHHRHSSWAEEYEKFMSAYGFDKING
ncbi:IS200/IS605 family transposase [Carboxylicivirga sediminis]|uniref:IS200/IS605 family transposase n=1 Tax=Carboxylicivirga sediminis TaxID=2006564 RepID=A0A941F606_9BACT|nr:IS200/IS605 family transposase [Carboxylicivirga sediminis]MBR8536305.1 IS200/IS605 family transposase [Carboxylicivirga sediminis]